MTFLGLCVGRRGPLLSLLVATSALVGCSLFASGPAEQTPPAASAPRPKADSNGQSQSTAGSGTVGCASCPPPASGGGKPLALPEDQRYQDHRALGASSGALLGALLGSSGLTSAGAGAAIGSAGRSRPAPGGPAAPAATAPKTDDGRETASDTIRLLFGTNRTANENGEGSLRDQFTSTRGGLALGFVDVSIPPTHTAGEIERPRWWKLEFSEDPALHMVIRSLSVVSTDQFSDLIKQYRGPQSRKPTILFVHGYNVSFADAALRTAQIANDLRIDSVPAFFSWASRADPEKYTVDENTALQSVPDFKGFLRQFTKNSTDRVFLIAHSMGSRIVTQALSEMIQAEPQVVKRVAQLVLAAPDLDAVVFREQIVPVFTGQKIPVTLYASSRDKTLKVSSGIHGCCRAGLGGSGIVVANGLESVDATTIDTSWLGHSYFAETRSLLADMNLLLAQGMRAGSRPLLAPRPSKKDPKYYYFVR